MLILGVNQYSTWEVTSQLCWDYLWQCWSGGSIDTQPGKSLCNFAGITFDSVDPGGSINTQLGKSLCNFAGITFDSVDLGVNWHSTWEVLCNFAGITSDSVDPVGCSNQHSTWEFTLQLCWDNLWQCWSWGVNQHSTWEVTLQLCFDYLWQCWSQGGVNWHSAWEVTLQLCWDYLWQCWSWWRGQLTLNLGSHFATLLGLPLTVLILGVNKHSTWEVTLQLCWDYLWQCWLGGLIDTQLGKSLCNFAGIISDSVDPVGVPFNTQLGKSLCNFAGITSDSVDPGGGNQHSTWEFTLQLCWTYLWQCWSWGVNRHPTWEVTLQLCWDNLWQCWSWGSINTQLGKSLCNFALITSDSVDLGVNWHSAWEVTLQLCWDYLWQSWSCRSINTQPGKSLCNFAWITSDSVDLGGQLTLNLGSHSATLLGLPLTMLILEVNQHSTWEVTLQPLLGLPLTVLILEVNWHSTREVTLQLCLDYLWQCWSCGGFQSTLNLGIHFATLLG